MAEDVKNGSRAPFLNHFAFWPPSNQVMGDPATSNPTSSRGDRDNFTGFTGMAGILLITQCYQNTTLPTALQEYNCMAHTGLISGKSHVSQGDRAAHWFSTFSDPNELELLMPSGHYKTATT